MANSCVKTDSLLQVQLMWWKCIVFAWVETKMRGEVVVPSGHLGSQLTLLPKENGLRCSSSLDRVQVIYHLRGNHTQPEQVLECTKGIARPRLIWEGEHGQSLSLRVHIRRPLCHFIK